MLLWAVGVRCKVFKLMQSYPLSDRALFVVANGDSSIQPYEHLVWGATGGHLVAFLI